jgi:hypothetical protein
LPVDYNKTPWPWLGDVDHYTEPFAGSLAVLLRRPHPCNRTYYSETVNDLDGLLVNAWRSIQHSPDAMAEAASWPVSEADLHARHLALVRWRAEHNLERLMADPEWHDPRMGGWWAWGQSCWIGGGWCSGRGPWVVGDDGRIEKRTGGGGVKRQLPQLGDDGRGINHANLREPGVKRKLPHLTSDGQGVNHAGLREPGVARQRPHIGDDGQGVNRPQLREPGTGDDPYHPMTMPELRRWLRFLSARLRHVRILNGDWKRAVTSGATRTLPVRQGGTCGIFLDPPYSAAANRKSDLYAEEDLQVATAVQQWAIDRGPDPDTRIVYAGYDIEGSDLEAAGWTAVEWYRAGFLRGGMGNIGTGGQQKRERLWLSPHCLRGQGQLGLF